jgi:hypothetical protein
MLVAWFQTKRMRNERRPMWICTEVSKEPDYQLTACSTPKKNLDCLIQKNLTHTIQKIGLAQTNF